MKGPICLLKADTELYEGWIKGFKGVGVGWYIYSIKKIDCEKTPFPPRDPRLDSQCLVPWWACLNLKWIWAR